MTTAIAEPRVRRHQIRPAGPEHIGALMGLYADLEQSRGRTVGSKERMAFGDAVFEALRDRTERILVATVGKKCIGFMWGRVLVSRFGALPNVLHVSHFFVAPEYRRFPRIAHDLYSTMRELAVKLGIPAVFEVPPDQVARWKRRKFRQLSATMLLEAPHG